MAERILVIGGGPAGMMCAIAAQKKHPHTEVLILEHNKELGKKLLSTGNGRCNVSVNVDNQEFMHGITKNAKFLYSALHTFSIKDVHDFFINRNCPLEEEDHKRLFPKTRKANSILNVFITEMNQLGVKVLLNCDVTAIDVDNKVCKTSCGDFTFKHIVIATGGASYAELGSDGKMFKILEQLGYKIAELRPSEVGLVSNDEIIASKKLQGSSFKDIKLTLVNEKGKKIKTIENDLLITHYGFSGPAALRMSFYVGEMLKKQKAAKLLIDFVDESRISKRVMKYFESLNLERDSWLHQLEVTINTTRGLKHAFVTNGGVSVKNINPKTMKSKLDDCVSFCGEVMDICGYTGGYNISLAMITGFTAGTSI